MTAFTLIDYRTNKQISAAYSVQAIKDWCDAHNYCIRLFIRRDCYVERKSV